MAGERLRGLKAELQAEMRRTAILQRFGRVFMLFACLGLSAGALYGVLNEGGIIAWSRTVGPLG